MTLNYLNHLKNLDNPQVENVNLILEMLNKYLWEITG